MTNAASIVRYRPRVRAMGMTAIARVAIAMVAITIATTAHAQPRPAAPVLTDLLVPVGDDARKAIAIGPSGQVYEPDGKGAWVRDRAVTMTDTVAVVGRANGVVALAGGAVYRLADNGWSALRLVQKGKAVMSGGARSVAAVGRQLFALDKLAGGEVAKLALAPSAVLQIGAGTKALTIVTDRGLLRAESAGAPWKPVARAPRRVERLIDDRWALTDRGPIDLKTGTVTPWPAGFRLGAVTPGPKGTLVLVGSQRGAIEVVVIDGVKVNRETIEVPADPDTAKKPDAHTTANPGTTSKPGTATEMKATLETKEPAKPSGPLANPVGVVTDTTGRLVVAFRDGRLAIRTRGAWSVTSIADALPTARPGAPPALSP